MNLQSHLMFWWIASLITVIGSDKTSSSAENVLDSIPDSSEEDGKEDEEKQSDEYKSGSICLYCKYCQVWIITVLSINHSNFATAPTSPPSQL